MSFVDLNEPVGRGGPELRSACASDSALARRLDDFGEPALWRRYREACR